MSTTAFVLRDVKKEIEDLIVGLTANRPVKNRNTFQIYNAEKTKPVKDATGLSRVFHVGEAVPQSDPWHVGYTLLAEKYHMPLTLVYARGEEWRCAALDDIIQIKNALLLTPTTVSGCAHRAAIMGPTAVEITQHVDPDQHWDYYTVTIEALLSVPAS